MSEFGTLDSRVRRKSLLSKVMKPEDTIKFFSPGQDLMWSGFTPAGYPKVVPIALANHVESQQSSGQMEIQPLHRRLRWSRNRRPLGNP